ATPVTGELIEWADVVLVMEPSHKRILAERFPEQLEIKKVGVLELPDIYNYMEPVLVQLLKDKVPSYVRI
ncbi:MAG: phosphotyrosine protein phosphatase, partial [Woeseiaceae bacterium]